MVCAHECALLYANRSVGCFDVELGDDLNSAIAISVINKTPIDAHTNRIISGRAPSAYLARLREQMPADMLEKVLGAHWIDAGALEADDFATTFIQRGAEMLDLIGRAMGRNLGSGRSEFEAALSSAGYLDLLEPEEEYDEIGEGEYGDTAREAAAQRDSAPSAATAPSNWRGRSAGVSIGSRY